MRKWLSLLSMCALLVGLALPGTAQGENISVLKPKAGRGNIKGRHVQRIVTSFAKAGEGHKGLHFGAKACSLKPVCIARVGAAHGHDKAVGVVVTRRKDIFKFNFLLVSTSNSKELARGKVRISKRLLVAKSGAALLAFVKQHTSGAAAPSAVPVAPAQPATVKEEPITDTPPVKPSSLEVQVLAEAIGDGFTVLPVQVTSSPPPRVGELKKRPELPRVVCDKAFTLPATATQPAGILAPAVERPTTVRCRAEHRGAQRSFEVTFTPPNEGLFASPERYDIFAGEETLRLRVFRREGALSEAFTATSSAGEVRVQDDGRIELQLPPGKAPRMITLFLRDGDSHGLTFIPVYGKAYLRVAAQKRASVVVRIAGASFGPVQLRRRVGRVAIEVPPGVKKAVVRATDRKGYAIESVSDLKIPSFQSVAVSAYPEGLLINTRHQILVALADENGRPAGLNSKLVTRVDRGSFGTSSMVSPGLWALEFNAPSKPGPVTMSIGLKRKRRRGKSKTALETTLMIRAGAPKEGEIELAPGPYRPGEELQAIVKFHDAQGNAIEGELPVATLGGKELEVSPVEHGYLVSGTIPNRLPQTGLLALKVSLHKTKLRRSLHTEGLEAVSAQVKSVSDEREPRVSLLILDTFGNLAPVQSFKVVVGAGGKLGELERSKGRYLVRVHPQDNARSTNLKVRSADQVLTSKRVEFAAPAGSFAIGVYAQGATDFGQVSSPHLAGGFGLRHIGSSIDVSALVGVESYRHRDSAMATLGGMSIPVQRSVDALAVPVLLHARFRLSTRVGLHFGAGIVPTRAKVRVSSDFQPADAYTEIRYGIRGLAGIDYQLGPGQFTLGGSYSSTELREAPLVGNLEGLTVTAGVQWWFAEI